jgi:hypothetical protein
VNNNGIDDAWETAHGLSLTTANRNASPAGNGVTVVQAYVAGTDPNDYYNGVAPVITSLVASNGQPGPDGLVAVRVTKQNGTLLPNAPLTFALTSGPSQIATVPGGAPATQLAIRTDAQGVGKVYLSFNSATSVVLMVSARSGAQTTNLSLTLNTPVVDTDHNGLPDDWELRYFSHVGVDPNADNDGDGVTNLQEYLSGTDPTDYYDEVLPEITSLVSPGGDLDGNGTLSVVIRKPDGTLRVNAPVTFRVKVGGHLLALSPGGVGANEQLVKTGANGVATVYVVTGGN